MPRRSFLCAVVALAVLVPVTASALVYVPLMLPMRDGTNLATDFYLPDDWASADYPTLLIRTPYDKSALIGLGAYADQGIAVVIQDTRGRFASQGTDPVFMSDGWGGLQDGYDTCLWIATTGAWYNGRIGTWGGSALGIIQYQLAGAAPPGLVAQVPLVGAPDLYDYVFYPGGSFREQDIVTWLDGQDSLSHLIKLRQHPTKDSWWEGANLWNRADVLTPAALHFGGWFDLFNQGTVDAFSIYRNEAGLDNQYLIMGPWSHAAPMMSEQNELTFPENAQGYWLPDPDPTFDFLLKALDGDLGSFASEPVHYYVMGDVDDGNAPGNEWRTSDNWPPPGIAEVPLYLEPDGGLGVDVPGEKADVSYVYDPADPTPSMCGLSLTFNPGPCDVSDYLDRGDVLFFATPELPQPVEVTGRVTLDLDFTSTANDTDFAAYFVDVYPDGRHMLFLHGIRRASLRGSLAERAPVVPGEEESIRIDLWTTSLVFNTGHRIGLFVASANFPMHEKNVNNFEQDGLRATWAENTILTGEGSVLRLPVAGDYPWEPAPSGDDDDASDDDDSNGDDDEGGDDDGTGDDDDDDDTGCGC